MARRVYRFENRDAERPYSLAQDTKGMPYYGDLRHLIASLQSLMKGEQQSLLDKNGYVIALDGPYGAGKTTAARTLLCELAEAGDGRILNIYHTFLPFNNPTEAISIFLTRLAEILWRHKFADIRGDIQQFILEVTPENRYEASVSLGGLSFTWPVFGAKSSYENVGQSISDKLSRACQQNRTVVIVLDDLDRLEPNQIVAIMRMVERLRNLPRVIIVLPFYKDIIKKAFITQLDIDTSIGSTLLRKLVDYEIKISNRQSDMERIFKNELAKNSPREEITHEQQDICWNMLLHNIIIAESYDLIAKEKSDEYNMSATLQKSPYLTELQRLFLSHVDDYRSRVEPYLVQTTESNGELAWAPIGHSFRSFANLSSSVNGPAQLAILRNTDTVMKPVATDNETIMAYKSTGNLQIFNERVSSEPALFNLFLPLLKAQKDEEGLFIDNYKLRDMSILARHIAGSRKLTAALKDPARLYTLVRETYDNFR